MNKNNMCAQDDMNVGSHVKVILDNIKFSKTNSILAIDFRDKSNGFSTFIIEEINPGLFVLNEKIGIHTDKKLENALFNMLVTIQHEMNESRC